jgi:hypothetical protein
VSESTDWVIVWMREYVPVTKVFGCKLMEPGRDNIAIVHLKTPVGSRPVVHGTVS